MLEKNIKNIIFDLGGVILDLDVDSTLAAFSVLSGIEMAKVKEIFASSPEFEWYEKGELTDQEFRDFIRQKYARHASDDDIDRAWNAMLLKFSPQKLQLLSALKKEYATFLLSNTNGIHLRQINGVILKKTTDEETLDNYFNKAYYSHLMGKRKPEPHIFEYVLAENNLNADETLFLDDNITNINSARALGIQVLHVNTSNLILEYFHA